jgi:hypothetical protein
MDLIKLRENQKSHCSHRASIGQAQTSWAGSPWAKHSESGAPPPCALADNGPAIVGVSVARTGGVADRGQWRGKKLALGHMEGSSSPGKLLRDGAVRSVGNRRWWLEWVVDAPDGWVVEHRGADAELIEVEGRRIIAVGELWTWRPSRRRRTAAWVCSDGPEMTARSHGWWLH